jgi:hypothetical protein
MVGSASGFLTSHQSSTAGFNAVPSPFAIGFPHVVHCGKKGATNAEDCKAVRDMWDAERALPI